MERAARAWIALGPDATAVQLDDTPTHVQPEPEPGEPSVVDITAAVEAIEYQRQVLGWNADPLVDHRDAGGVPFAPDADEDVAAGGTELDGVFDEALEQLPHPDGIEPADHRGVAVHRTTAPATAHVARDGREVDGLNSVRWSGGLRPRGIQELLNQRLESSSLPDQPFQSDLIDRAAGVALSAPK